MLALVFIFLFAAAILGGDVSGFIYVAAVLIIAIIGFGTGGGKGKR